MPIAFGQLDAINTNLFIRLTSFGFHKFQKSTSTKISIFDFLIVMEILMEKSLNSK